VSVDLWTGDSTAVKAAITQQAERLAAHRQVALAGVVFDG